ncbi:MAG: hypothetical protein ACXV2C_04170 [Candidatus Bathyarchaeia archaeon]
MISDKKAPYTKAERALASVKPGVLNNLGKGAVAPPPKLHSSWDNCQERLRRHLHSRVHS